MLYLPDEPTSTRVVDLPWWQAEGRKLRGLLNRIMPHNAAGSLALTKRTNRHAVHIYDFGRIQVVNILTQRVIHSTSPGTGKLLYFSAEVRPGELDPGETITLNLYRAGLPVTALVLDDTTRFDEYISGVAADPLAAGESIFVDLIVAGFAAAKDVYLRVYLEARTQLV